MNLKYMFWRFNNVISNEECVHFQNALKEGYTSSQLWKKATIEQDNKLNLKIRDTNIMWLPSDSKKISDLLHEYLIKANNSAGWMYDVDFIESSQLAQYKKDQFYTWHQDMFPAEEGKSVRKISAILSLNNATEYEGGEVEMHTGHPDENPFTIEELKIQGTLIFFPSFIWHRVKPITKGVRYSLVTWAQGEPFR